MLRESQAVPAPNSTSQLCCWCGDCLYVFVFVGYSQCLDEEFYDIAISNLIY